MADSNQPANRQDVFVGADPIDADFTELEELQAQVAAEEQAFLESQSSVVEIEEENLAVTDPKPEPAAEEEPATTETPAEQEEQALEHEEPAAPPRKKERITIPKERLDKEIARRRELERRLAQLEQDRTPAAAAPAPAPASAFTDDDVDLMFDAVMDGQGKVAREKFASIISAVVEQTVTRTLDQVPDRAVDAVRSATVRETLDQTVARIEATYPMLDSRSEEYDPILTEVTLGFQRGLMAKEGLDAAEALEKGALQAIKQLRPDVLESDDETEPAEPTAPAKPAAAEATREKRLANSLQKKIELADKQPGRASASANRRDVAATIDVDKLTIEELESIPDSVLRKLRGDFIN